VRGSVRTGRKVVLSGDNFVPPVLKDESRTKMNSFAAERVKVPEWVKKAREGESMTWIKAVLSLGRLFLLTGKR